MPFTSIIIDAHWNYHAMLMFFIWFMLMPLAIMSMRYLKPKPGPDYGIPAASTYFFSRMHIWGSYTAVCLTIAGAFVAILTVGGFSRSLHSYFGIGTLVFGCLQVVAAWFRGSHGGKYGHGADPDDPRTWHADHFDMTPKRQRFEAYHTTAGYFTLVMAAGAILTGLIQYWMPNIMTAAVIIFFGCAVLAIIAEYRGMRYDTYRSVYGTHPDLPFNKARAPIEGRAP
ncbi:MAG: hypothetical protein GY798_20360 [Hyphomicrobiales bacterium]|nr:hypothetical protein [Hyphomicrobiales bacterium]